MTPEELLQYCQDHNDHEITIEMPHKRPHSAQHRRFLGRHGGPNGRIIQRNNGNELVAFDRHALIAALRRLGIQPANGQTDAQTRA